MEVAFTKKLKSTLNSGNVSYYSVHSLFFYYRLPSKNFKIKIYKTIILRADSYGWETWSDIQRGYVRKEFRGEYLDLRGRNKRQNGEKYQMKSFVTYTLHQILLG
jgi:hypothetical protein